MNDLEIIHDAWGRPAPPPDHARRSARAALLARASEEAAGGLPESSRSVAWRGLSLPRVAMVGGVSILAALTFTLADTGTEPGSRSAVPGLPGVEVAAADQVLERAAVAAEARPFVPPTPHQWMYLRNRLSEASVRGPAIENSWNRADGQATARLDANGELVVERFELPADRVEDLESKLPPGGYEAIAALPRDPDALLDYVYEQGRRTTGGASTEDGDAFLILIHLLRDNVVPPEVEAAIYRALQEIPTVRVAEVEIFGDTALSLSMDTSSWLRQELLLDPDSYAYRGERSTVTRDTTIDPLKAGNETGAVHKGSTVTVERLASGIVDRPGDLP